MSAQVRLSFEQEPPSAEGVGPRIIIDGAKSADKTEFMQELASKLSFPDYFGANWDAFDEVITEFLDSNVHSELIIGVRNGRELWRNLPYDAGKFLQCLFDAFDRTSKRGQVVFYEM